MAGWLAGLMAGWLPDLVPTPCSQAQAHTHPRTTCKRTHMHVCVQTPLRLTAPLLRPTRRSSASSSRSGAGSTSKPFHWLAAQGWCPPTPAKQDAAVPAIWIAQVATTRTGSACIAKSVSADHSGEKALWVVGLLGSKIFCNCLPTWVEPAAGHLWVRTW